MRKIVIAIDGYSACGKSSTAKNVAKELNYRYIDSGAMYRAVTLYFLDHLVAITNSKEVEKAIREIQLSFRVNAKGVSELFMNGINVEKDIRKMRISENVSPVSALKEVREAMVAIQRKLGKDKGIVMDGRDIGSVVFPDAELKVFLTADILVRAFRRQKELLQRDDLVDIDTIVGNLASRDQIDSTRKESPLVKSADAFLIDTTHITIDEQVDEVIRLALSKMVGNRARSN
ncbi:MAG: (d)CMP kinase [Cytophagales bacterium]|jgi:cytidylate kinase|nr:(d)CMP kinase [Cytophagales bacterium]MCA6394623.1 (d)CMP kinase [Cytophagales bacterium]MCA6400721.1 (d)CMP kinase [Cytophagales bacterium]MCA6431132.1 (d)CMP kinase [Cytophagales bacterium]MCA6432754.1 (d)CMP kinase [Cytophagales bacterium]